MTVVRWRIRALALAAALVGGVVQLYAQEPDADQLEESRAGSSARDEVKRLIHVPLPNRRPGAGFRSHRR